MRLVAYWPIVPFRCGATACRFSAQGGDELRLVVGPPVSANAAAKLCNALERFRLTCQPTIFAGRHLAMDR